MYDYGYNDYGASVEQVGNTIGAVLIGVVIISIVSLVLVVLQFIGQWKCFKKAGYNGWEVLIGGHNQFVNCTFAGVNPLLILGLMFGSVVTVIPVVGPFAYLGFFVYYQIVVGLNTAKAFGKGTGFGVALAIPFSAPIAWFILGKAENVYVGPQNKNNTVQPNVQMNNQPTYPQQVQPTVMSTPQVDPVQPVVIPTPQVTPSQPEPQSAAPAFCTNCGNALAPNTKFCTNCGKQI